MKRRNVLTVILYAGSVALVGIVGIALGSMWGTHEGHAKRDELQAGLQKYLETNVHGLEIGARFPEVNLWPADGSEAVTSSDLLAHGGLVLFVSTGCKTCIDAVSALNRAVKTTGTSRPVFLVCRSECEGLQVEMKERSISFPIYRDMEDAFIRRYNILTQPTAFLVEPSGILSSMRSVLDNQSDFIAMLSN